MIKVKLLDNRFSVMKRIKELEDKLQELPKAYLKELANEIVLNSPVDTGTYMDNHNIGEVGQPASSHGKPRNQPYQDHADNAIDRLHRQIDNLPSDSSKYYISNSADHAWFVEYEHEGLKGGPYTVAKAKSKILLEIAKDKIGIK